MTIKNVPGNDSASKHFVILNSADAMQVLRHVVNNLPRADRTGYLQTVFFSFRHPRARFFLSVIPGLDPGIHFI